ncbi:MAG: hypothetical protein AAGA91_00205 [Pseudomonadota bacterium]
MSAEGGHIVIGLGTGRSGTASLSSLLDRQEGGICFHELNPSCAVFKGNAQPQLNVVCEFRAILAGGDRSRLSVDYSRPASVHTYERLQAMGPVRLIGDIAYYYLNYVEDILRCVPECKFVCIKRDRTATVDSWIKKSSIRRWPSLWLGDRITAMLTRTPFYSEYNYWQDHDGSTYKPDSVWDSTFPKFDAPNKRAAIEMYWDAYYVEAGRLAGSYPGSFRIFAIEDLSDANGQEEILNFIGLGERDRSIGGDVHLHKSE